MSVHFPAPLLSPRVAVLVIATAGVLVAPPVALAQSNGGGGACLAGVICGNPIDWLHQAISDVLTAFLTTMAHAFADAIVRFINDVNFITHTPENLTYTNALALHSLQLLGSIRSAGSTPNARASLRIVGGRGSRPRSIFKTV